MRAVLLNKIVFSMEENMCRITVFTATYNRAYILTNLYESLKKQTYTNFEWLIINDGSTDNTDSLVQSFISNENKFNIRYIKHTGLGKHVAMNKAIKIAKGELFMSVDSDDFLREDALEMIDKYEKSITDKNEFAGVSGLRCDLNGKVIGDEWQHNSMFIDATNFERQKYRLLGDKAEAYYTRVLKKYSLPQFEGERFMAEIIWNQIANDGYKLRWFNEKIYIGEYLEDGLTSNIIKNNLNNFNGYTYCTREELKFKQISLLNKLKKLIVYCKLSRIKGKTYKDVAKNLNLNKVIASIVYITSRIVKYEGI